MAAPAVIPSLVPIFVLASMRRAEARIHRQLVEAGAVTAEKAIDVTLNRSFDTRRLQALVSKGAVRRTSEGRHFLDEGGWAAYQSNRRQRATVALCVVLGLIALGAIVLVALR